MKCFTRTMIHFFLTSINLFNFLCFVEGNRDPTWNDEASPLKPSVPFAEFSDGDMYFAKNQEFDEITVGESRFQDDIGSFVKANNPNKDKMPRCKTSKVNFLEFLKTLRVSGTRMRTESLHKSKHITTTDEPRQDRMKSTEDKKHCESDEKVKRSTQNDIMQQGHLKIAVDEMNDEKDDEITMLHTPSPAHDATLLRNPKASDIETQEEKVRSLTEAQTTNSIHEEEEKSITEMEATLRSKLHQEIPQAFYVRAHEREEKLQAKVETTTTVYNEIQQEYSMVSEKENERNFVRVKTTETDEIRPEALRTLEEEGHNEKDGSLTRDKVTLDYDMRHRTSGEHKHEQNIGDENAMFTRDQVKAVMRDLENEYNSLIDHLRGLDSKWAEYEVHIGILRTDVIDRIQFLQEERRNHIDRTTKIVGSIKPRTDELKPDGNVDITSYDKRLDKIENKTQWFSELKQTLRSKDETLKKVIKPPEEKSRKNEVIMRDQERRIRMKLKELHKETIFLRTKLDQSENDKIELQEKAKREIEILRQEISEILSRLDDIESKVRIGNKKLDGQAESRGDIIAWKKGNFEPIIVGNTSVIFFLFAIFMLARLTLCMSMLKTQRMDSDKIMEAVTRCEDMLRCHKMIIDIHTVTVDSGFLNSDLRSIILVIVILFAVIFVMYRLTRYEKMLRTYIKNTRNVMTEIQSRTVAPDLTSQSAVEKLEPITVVSFQAGSAPASHKQMVESVMNRKEVTDLLGESQKTLEMKQVLVNTTADIEKIINSLFVFVFVDHNDAMKILEDQLSKVEKVKTKTVQAALEMSDNVIVVYCWDTKSKDLDLGILYSPRLENSLSHPLLLELRKQQSIYSIYKSFTYFQQCHLTKKFESSFKRSEDMVLVPSSKNSQLQRTTTNQNVRRRNQTR